MEIEPFELERIQSIWEHVVDYNLAESGIHPISLDEFLNEKELEKIKEIKLGYSQTNGTPELREKIAKLYPGAKIENILVTNGSSEANFLLVWSSIEPGDEVILMLPNYMQIWGLLRCFSANIKPFYLKESLNWSLDLEELNNLITEKTKLIIITNPNNPTGAVLNTETMEIIIDLASKVGAWIFSDEVYRGAELEGEITPSFWGKYDKIVVVSGLSKAYALPGLRIGWIVGKKDLIDKLWHYHDYTTIAPSTLSDWIARIALSPENIEKIRKRNRSILKENFSLLKSWLEKQNGVFQFIPPKAGAIVFVKYNLKINSSKFVNKLIREKSVLIASGDNFNMDYYLRFGYGVEKNYLKNALSRVEEAIEEIKAEEF